MTASFGQLIKEQRIEMGLTQQRLADLVGRSPSTVRSWERDRATPNDEIVIDSLSAVLGLDKRILSDLAGVELESPWYEPNPSGTLIEDASPRTGSREDRPEEGGAVDAAITGDRVDDVEDRPDSDREARPQVLMGPEPAPRSNGDELRIPGTARAPEPAKPYLLQTDRRADQGRPGPLRPGVDDVAEPSLFSDQAPDPVEPPSDWDAEIDLDDLPDPESELRGIAPAGPTAEPADLNPPVPEPAPETAESQSAVEADEDGWENEPTQILMPTAPAEERLLGVATAKAVEYLAEPRPRPLPDPEPEEAEATEVIDRTPLVEPAPTVEIAAQATEPVRPVSMPGGGAQPRTQTMESGRPIGPNSYLDDPNEIRGYRIRAGLTAAALIAMLIVARWAWTGFREQLGGILDTLTTGF